MANQAQHGTSAVLAHSAHIWEEWHAYLAAELPEGVTLNDSGIYCHTCSVVVVG